MATRYRQDQESSVHTSVIDVSALLSSDIRRSYEHLESDSYHPDGTRFRRFAQYHLSFAHDRPEVDRLPLRPFTQRTLHNNLIGNVLRYFPQITVNLDSLVIRGFEESRLSREKAWQVDCHQVRVEIRNGQAGRATPEGIHRDGVDYILMVCAGSSNMSGGESQVYDSDKNLAFSRVLRGGESLLVDDRVGYHYTTEFYVEERTNRGYRDMLIIAYFEQSEGRYGPDYERRVTGNEADISRIEALRLV